MTDAMRRIPEIRPGVVLGGYRVLAGLDGIAFVGSRSAWAGFLIAGGALFLMAGVILISGELTGARAGAAAAVALLGLLVGGMVVFAHDFTVARGERRLRQAGGLGLLLRTWEADEIDPLRIIVHPLEPQGRQRLVAIVSAGDEDLLRLGPAATSDQQALDVIAVVARLAELLERPVEVVGEDVVAGSPELREALDALERPQ